MWLERRLIKNLQKLNDKKEYPTRNEFALFIAKKIWPRINYPFDTFQEFHERIDKVLGDCIGGNPEQHFIDYDDTERRNLLVTRRGRKFIKTLGYIQIVLEEYNQISALLVALGIGGLIGYFWNLIKQYIF